MVMHAESGSFVTLLSRVCGSLVFVCHSKATLEKATAIPRRPMSVIV